MPLTPMHVERLESFFSSLAQEIYPEPMSALHSQITEQMVTHLVERHSPPAGARVLDVGCGQGVALQRFVSLGLHPVGVTLGADDLARCREQGFEVREMDQSFLDFDDHAFDVVWCRHALEHSPIPLFTLRGFHRVLKDGGLLYVEVPAPDTSCAHQSNVNHYSVLGQSAWLELFGRSGFEVLEGLDLSFTTGSGPDLYWAFFLRRPAVTPDAPRTRAATANIYLGMPIASMFGWGICGRYITREMSRLDKVRLITPSLTVEEAGVLDFDELRPLQPEGDEAAVLASGRVLQVDAPVLMTIRTKEMTPLEPRLRGRFNLGYTFFEDNVLAPAWLDNARRNFDAVATGSQWCTDVLRDHGLENVTTVIQGVDPVIFEPSVIPREYFRDRFAVFSGGKFELRKGQDLVLRAFKVLADKYPDVVLVASWYNLWPTSLMTMHDSPYIRFAPSDVMDYNALMKRVLVDNGIDPQRVCLLPAQPNTSMARIYKNTDVGLFPNRCEGGTNLVLMEYMACGKPVIASYSSGHRDVVTEMNALRIEKMGRMEIKDGDKLVAIWDDPDLDETIALLEHAYNNRDRMEQLGRRAGQDAEHWTWGATARRFHRILTTGQVPRD